MHRRSASGDRRVGRLELLLFEAAKLGDLQGLRKCLELLEEHGGESRGERRAGYLWSPRGSLATRCSHGVFTVGSRAALVSRARRD